MAPPRRLEVESSRRYLRRYGAKISPMQVRVIMDETFAEALARLGQKVQFLKTSAMGTTEAMYEFQVVWRDGGAVVDYVSRNLVT